MLAFILILLASQVCAYDDYSYDSSDLSTLKVSPTDWLLARLRRNPTTILSAVRTLSAEELAGVKDALQQMMPHHNLDELITSTTDHKHPAEHSTTAAASRNTEKEDTLKVVVADGYEDYTSSVQLGTETHKWLTMHHTRVTATTTPNYDYDADDTTTGPTRTKERNETFPIDFLNHMTEIEIVRQRKTSMSTSNTTNSTTSTTTTTTRRTRRSKTTPMRIDIAKLMALVSNLTMSYQAELAALLNKSLEQYTIPTCPTPTETTTTELPTTTDMYGNLTGTIMGKCFVCGLTDHTIPRNAHCADAFSGDFIPLVPVNAQAKAHIARFRKYCRWMNVPKYYINESEPRSMWGRWTGGCSVRWIDVSGVYTQRTCRNRHRATMGNHWVSKRMAKLEMALQHIDNGCIISPMSSLVPLSRGISLYARFHTCVCTGNWCNLAMKIAWSPHVLLLGFILSTVT